jgi:signal transduction histidine kinase
VGSAPYPVAHMPPGRFSRARPLSAAWSPVPAGFGPCRWLRAQFVATFGGLVHALGKVRSRGDRILVIDDDPDIRSSLEDILRDSGYLTTAAADGKAALESLRRAAGADLILLDLMMPVMDGWRFRLEQRKDAALCRIPVIALSASSSAQAAAVDADAYLAKPFAIETLLGTIQEVLGRARAARLEAADRLAALGTLAAGIAHEINNPLTYLMANLQVLAEMVPAATAPSAPPAPAIAGRRAAEIRDLIADAMEGAERIRRIVSQVQTASASQHPEEHRPVDLRATLEAALRLVGNELRHRAHVLTDLEGTPYVLGDSARLEQVFIHLLTNAAHALGEMAPQGQEVRVKLRAGADRAAVEIADTGPGIPPEIRNRIFQPFFTTKPVGTGAGLGLAICRGIVEALGGEINVESEMGRGSLFRVSLPTVPAPAAATEAPAGIVAARSEQATGAAPGPGPARAAGRRAAVLVVDDEPAVLRSLELLLAREHDITTADSARRALEIIEDGRAGRYDVVLCDLMMPEMSGMELYDQLRARRPEMARRVVFMTGGAFTPQGQRFLMEGRHTCVAKPIDRDALTLAIAVLIDSG